MNWRIGFLISCLLCVGSYRANAQCGSCAAPTCIIEKSVDFASAESKHDNWTPISGLTFCETYIPAIAGPSTNESYHSVTIGTSGTLGAVISAFAGGGFGCTISRTYELFPASSTCDAGSVINPDNNNANGSSYGNPEWSNLVAGASYIVKVTYNIPLGCNQEDHCQIYYSPDTVVTGGCTANPGGTKVEIEGVEVTDASNEYDVCLNQTIKLTQNAPTFQSGNDPTVGYAVLNCSPTSVNPVDDACHLGNDLDSSVTLNSGVFPGNTYYAVPLTFDDRAIENPDENGDGCYGKGPVIKINFLATTCSVPSSSCNCSTPNCPVGNVNTYADRFPPSGAQTCVSGLNETGAYTTYQEVTSDNNGFLGAYVQGLTSDILADVTITSKLYPVGSCDVSASAIPSDGNNINNRSLTNGSWNPEWSNLAANTNYILVTTFNISFGNMQGYCMDYYGTVPPLSAACDCSSPSCTKSFISDPNSPTFSACENWGYYANDTVVTNYYTIPSSSTGSLGFLQQLGADPGCTPTQQSTILNGRTYELFAVGDCDGSALAVTTANAGYSSSLNPEWDNLTPSTNYILKVTVTVPNTSCGITSTCLDYYHPTGGSACDCGTPNCAIGSVNTYDDRFPPSGAQTCVSGLNATGNYTTYQTVTTDVTGFVGAYVQAFQATGTTFFTVTSALYPTSDCNGTALTADGNNIHNRSSGAGSWNPEWSGLTPNTDYILVTTFAISGSGAMTDYCMDYYGSSCSAEAGTVSSSTSGNALTLATNEHVLCPGAQVLINSNGFTLPPSDPLFADPSMGYLLYLCEPPVAPDPFNDACVVTIGGTPVVIDDTANTSDFNDGSTVTNFPGATDQTYWIVPITLKAQGPDLLIDSSCYDVGTPVKVTYLNAVAITEDTSDCNIGEVTISVTGGYPEFFAGTYTLSNLGAGNLNVTSVSNSGESFKITGLSDGEQYSVRVVDTTGCADTITGTFVGCDCSTQGLLAAFDLTSNSGNAPFELSLTNSSENATGYQWFFGNGDTSSSFEPTYIYDLEGEYDLFLVATNDNGCIDTSSTERIVVTELCELTFPTAFTPDDNGQNDEWLITCFDAREGAEVTVYNRWGTRVYNSVGGNDYVPWNGKNDSGQTLPSGSYFYVITVDDDTTYNGTITLIK